MGDNQPKMAKEIDDNICKKNRLDSGKCQKHPAIDFNVLFLTTCDENNSFNYRSDLWCARHKQAMLGC